MHFSQQLARKLPVFFWLALAAVFAWIVARNWGLYPMVFADEWHYSNSARLHPLSESILPSYLFLSLYSLTSVLGDRFLDGARVLNTIFFVGAAPFLYLIARPLCGRPAAALVAVLSLVGGVNSYTAYFMPESMYFFLFAVLSWGAMAWRALSPWRYGMALGLVLGLMLATKVHALFLIPALLVFLLYRSFADYRNEGWLLKAALMIVCALAATLLVRFAAGYLLAGPNGLNLFGNFYGGLANSTSSSMERWLRLLPPAVLSLKGHLLGLALLLALPLARMGLQAASAQARRDSPPGLGLLMVYTFLMLGAALAMTVMFTASLLDGGPAETMRLHQRYYNFLFPLLFIIAAAAAGLDQAGTLRARVVAAVLAGAALVFAAVTLQPTFLISHVDSPELFSVLRNTAFRLFVPLALLTLGLWAWRARIGGAVFLCVLLPVMALSGAHATRIMFRGALTANEYDRAGMAARQHVGRDGANRLTVVGDGPGPGPLRALFHIDAPGAQHQDLAPGAPLAPELVSPRRDWILVVGQHALPADMVPTIRTPEFALVKVNTGHRPFAMIKMSKPLEAGVLLRHEGFSVVEGWGMWSAGKEVRMHFAQALPKSLTVLIKARAIGPNVGQDFVMQVGDQRKTFRLAESEQERLLRFDTDGSVKTIMIEVPHPVSPESLGHKGDTRTLGIALAEVELGNAAAN